MWRPGALAPVFVTMSDPELIIVIVLLGVAVILMYGLGNRPRSR